MSRYIHMNFDHTAALVLKDGTVYHGMGHGPDGLYEGEAVFCTGMVGYTESLTDPSYYNQFLTFSYPLIGNYGVASFDDRSEGLPRFFESDSIKARAMVAHEVCEHPSHWSCDRTLPQWLCDEQVPAISGIDTRDLTKRLRVHGVMPALLAVGCEGDLPDIGRLRTRAAKMDDPTNKNLVREVSTPVTTVYNGAGDTTVVLLDCGAKYGIIKSLLRRNVRVVRVRYDTPIDVIETYKPDGVLVSNGPGNPDRVDTICDTIDAALNRDIPTVGICMGIQLLSLSQGAETYKLKFGHRSQNQPCRELGTSRCYITSQNHGYVVDPASLEGTDLSLWMTNANDGSCEGVTSSRLNTFAVQFHPEANPGPRDTDFLFDRFLSLMGD